MTGVEERLNAKVTEENDDESKEMIILLLYVDKIQRRQFILDGTFLCPLGQGSSKYRSQDFAHWVATPTDRLIRAVLGSHSLHAVLQ